MFGVFGCNRCVSSFSLFIQLSRDFFFFLNLTPIHPPPLSQKKYHTLRLFHVLPPSPLP
jgi:hypothetical protein